MLTVGCNKFDMIHRHVYVTLKLGNPRLSGLRRPLSTSRISDPLRILFCGSDDLSVSSLKALHWEYKRSSGLIKSIDVVCKSAKRTGRGLKTLREGSLWTEIGGMVDPDMRGSSTYCCCCQSSLTSIARNRYLYWMAGLSTLLSLPWDHLSLGSLLRLSASR